eukprot:9736515-Alexandrium_andersonii.AAC.1
MSACVAGRIYQPAPGDMKFVPSDVSLDKNFASPTRTSCRLTRNSRSRARKFVSACRTLVPARVAGKI